MDEVYISIIVPVFNIESYISRCLESILHQTYPYIEIVAVDDGSKDCSGQILDDFAKKHNNIKVIHQSNQGVTKARLAGVAAAKGEYIGFVDGDDFVEDEMYEMLMANIILYQAEISHCGYQMVFLNRIDYYYGSKKIILQDNFKGLKDLLSGDFVEPGLWNKLYHKSLFDEILYNNILDTSIKNMEDLLMNYYLFKKSKCSIFQDVCPYHYVIREGSAAKSQFSVQKLWDPVKVMEFIMQDSLKNKEIYQVVYERYIYSLIHIVNGNHSLTVEKKNAQNRLKKELKVSGCFRLLRKKVYLMAWGISHINGIYQLVYRLYDKFTGVSHKYDID